MRRLRGASCRIVHAAETQRIHHRDGTRAHGKDVAQDAADPGGRALQGLDEAGVIVRFDLEGDDVTVANIDDAGVLARALHHQLAARGQLLQMNARALVGAVLAPHHGEDAEFGVGGLAAEDTDHLVIFAGRELMLGDDFRGKSGAHAGTAARGVVWTIDCTMDWNTINPSVEPISGSVRRSGWGIMPITLRSRLSTPAILRSEPLALSM